MPHNYYGVPQETVKSIIHGALSDAKVDMSDGKTTALVSALVEGVARAIDANNERVSKEIGKLQDRLRSADIK